MLDVYPLIHIFAAVILMGHMLYWAMVVRPLHKSAKLSEGDQLLRQIVRRSSWIGWVCLVVLIVTGIFMLSNWHVTPRMVTSGEFFRSRFGRLLTVKSLATVIIMMVFFFPVSRKVRLARFNFLIALMVIILSILLVR